MYPRMALLIFFVSLFFLAGCEQDTIIAQPPDEALAQQIHEQQACATLTCRTNEQCKNGACVCADNFKDCGGMCIPTTSCCSHDDCTEESFCDTDNHCHKKPQTCDYNQQWNTATESCSCISGTKFCETQNKCIPQHHCCVVEDCTLRRDVCVPTIYSASVCINDPKQHCRNILEGAQQRFTLETKSFEILLQNIFQDGAARLLIDENATTATINETVQIDDETTLLVEGVKSLGGTCKTYND